MSEYTAKSLMFKLAENQLFMSFNDPRHLPSNMMPGQIIMSLPEKDRELLKTLTSEDIQNIRWPYWV